MPRLNFLKYRFYFHFVTLEKAIKKSEKKGKEKKQTLERNVRLGEHIHSNNHRRCKGKYLMAEWVNCMACLESGHPTETP